jgi:regulator of replication initiation timing
MVRRESSMRSETVTLEGECHRLQLLVGELLLKNHELRCEVARLRDALDAKAPQAKKVQMPPVRFAVSKTIFDWESIG